MEQFLTEWLERIKLRIRPQTWAARSNVRNHLPLRLGKEEAHRAVGRDVRLMVDDLKVKGASPRMVHSTVRVALQHAVAEELVTRNVARSVRVAQPSRDSLTEPLTAEERSGSTTSDTPA